MSHFRTHFKVDFRSVTYYRPVSAILFPKGLYLFIDVIEALFLHIRQGFPPFSLV